MRIFSALTTHSKHWPFCRKIFQNLRGGKKKDRNDTSCGFNSSIYFQEKEPSKIKNFNTKKDDEIKKIQTLQVDVLHFAIFGTNVDNIRIALQDTHWRKQVVGI